MPKGSVLSVEIKLQIWNENGQSFLGDGAVDIVEGERKKTIKVVTPKQSR